MVWISLKTPGSPRLFRVGCARVSRDYSGTPGRGRRGGGRRRRRAPCSRLPSCSLPRTTNRLVEPEVMTTTVPVIKPIVQSSATVTQRAAQHRVARRPRGPRNEVPVRAIDHVDGRARVAGDLEDREATHRVPPWRRSGRARRCPASRVLRHRGRAATPGRASCRDRGSGRTVGPSSDRDLTTRLALTEAVPAC
jgi:hypothetical protein